MPNTDSILKTGPVANEGRHARATRAAELGNLWDYHELADNPIKPRGPEEAWMIVRMIPEPLAYHDPWLAIGETNRKIIST